MTGPSWQQVARVRLRELADSGQPFTADDLYDSVDHPDLAHAANGRNNAIGSLFGEAHKTGMIIPVGVQKSRQPHRKGGMVRVWRGTGQPSGSLF